MTQASLRPRAAADLVERTRYYRINADENVAARFFDSAVAALGAVERMPGTGSPRIGELCGVPGLRMRRIADFPCGWFYIVRDNHIDVVRLLADAQDLVAILTDLEDE